MNGVRFAPSPTGTFHLGNLRTAYVAHAWARALGEPWVVRFEDIDEPRVVVGARESQLADMAALHLRPDGIENQSTFRGRHWTLLKRAIAQGQVYPCTCSRKQVQQALKGLASAPHAPEAIYDGRCRKDSPRASVRDIAWRFRGADPSGRGDFIVARTDIERQERTFVPAYHWACAIDDFDGGYRLLVRSSDLAAATPTQRAIQGWLARTEGKPEDFAAVFHSSLVTGDEGQRLEKRTRGVTLAELVKAGWTADKVRRLLQASFAPKIDELTPGRVWGETTPQVTLRELGLGALGVVY